MTAYSLSTQHFRREGSRVIIVVTYRLMLTFESEHVRQMSLCHATIVSYLVDFEVVTMSTETREGRELFSLVNQSVFVIPKCLEFLIVLLPTLAHI